MLRGNHDLGGAGIVGRMTHVPVEVVAAPETGVLVMAQALPLALMVSVMDWKTRGASVTDWPFREVRFQEPTMGSAHTA
jgi:hypothetical protein